MENNFIDFVKIEAILPEDQSFGRSQAKVPMILRLDDSIENIVVTNISGKYATIRIHRGSLPEDIIVEKANLDEIFDTIYDALVNLLWDDDDEGNNETNGID